MFEHDSSLVALTSARWRALFREPGGLVWTLVFPFLACSGLALSSSPGAADHALVFDRSPSVWVASLLASCIVLSAIYNVAWSFIHMRFRGYLRRLLVTPLPRYQVPLSLLAQRLTLTLFDTVVILGFAIYVLRWALAPSVGTLLVLVVIGAVAFSALGVVIASFSESIEMAMGLMNLAILPLLALSGTIIPAEKLPPALQAVAPWSPLGALARALAVGVGGGTLGAIAVHDLAVLGVFLVGASVGALLAARRLTR